MRSTYALFRRPIKQVLVSAFLIFHVFEIAKVLRCLSISTVEAVDQRPERVYIASLHWNNEHILRSHWNNAVVALANALGRDNVFVTVYESGSWDDSKDEISVWPRGPGWIDTPRGTQELRRIPYLSRLRNLALEPLWTLAKQGEIFDKVLFLNDVAFNTVDVLRLLNTNGGDYAAACSLDFSHPPEVYDTFALRDAEGHEMLMQKWPYFRAEQSRQAILANRPVPVTSCWNGMVAMTAEPFISSPPLRFRGIPDSLANFHLEGSECCLIHMDNPLGHQKRTYVNPQVLVGYSGEAYSAIHSQQLLSSSWQISKALWENRIRRWVTSPLLKEWIVRSRVNKWRTISKDHREPGVNCLIDEMQVLVENGWAHV